MNPNSLNNLKPFKKGDKRPANAGRKKGYISPKELFLKTLTKENAIDMAKGMIAKAVSGSIAAQQFIYEITGDYTRGVPTVTVNNSISIPDEIMVRAQELAANKYFNKNNVIDVSSTPIENKNEINISDEQMKRAIELKNKLN